MPRPSWCRRGGSCPRRLTAVDGAGRGVERGRGRGRQGHGQWRWSREGGKFVHNSHSAGVGADWPAADVISFHGLSESEPAAATNGADSGQQSAASRRSSVVGSQAIFGISRQSSVISRQSSVVSRQSSVISRQSSAVSYHHQPSPIRHQSSSVSYHRQLLATSRQFSR